MALKLLPVPMPEWRRRRIAEAGTVHYMRCRARRGEQATKPLFEEISGVSGFRTPIDRATYWLAPWVASGGWPRYPGRMRIMLATLGGKVLHRAFETYRSGAKDAPPWVLRTIADVVERRSVVGAAIVVELRAAAANREAAIGVSGSGGNFRAARAAGVSPSGLGARGRTVAASEKAEGSGKTP